MISIFEYIKLKDIKVSKVRYDINDINRLLYETFDIKLVKEENDTQFNEITYWYEYSDDMFNLFRDYYNNIGSTKLNQELHEYTNFDKRLEFRIHNLNSTPCTSYCIETISSPSRREIFVNCIKYNDGDKDRIIMILKTDTDIDIYDNTYIILKYLFDKMS